MIDVVNLTTSAVDEGFVQKVIENALRYVRAQGAISLGVAFIGKERMRKLNKEFRGTDRATDVFSFESGRDFAGVLGEGKYVGEIVVCNAVVEKHAVKSGVFFERELAHVLIHGTLHLLGYDHEGSLRKTEEMHEKEEEVMNAIGI